jgi:hypothetical protein
VGLLYFWIHASRNPVLSSQFVLLKSAKVEYTQTDSNQVSFRFGRDAAFPCSGVITATGEGYIYAPALKLAVSLGRDIVFLLLSPATVPHEVSVEKGALSIHGEEGTVTLSTENGELRCAGTISESFKTARIILNRNPGLPVYKEGFNATLQELMEPGSISCVWKPVARSFEEQLLVFHPNIASTYGFGPSTGYPIPSDLRRIMGVSADDTDYVLGDGVGVDYKICLVIGRGLGRHFSDEARLIVK